MPKVVEDRTVTITACPVGGFTVTCRGSVDPVAALTTKRDLIDWLTNWWRVPDFLAEYEEQTDADTE